MAVQLVVDIDKEMHDLEKRLGNLRAHAPRILRTAINKTAVQSRKLLLDKAKETYAVKAGGFTGKSKSALQIQKASTSKLYAKLHSEGSPIDLYKFRVSPATYQTGDNKPSAMRGKALKVGGLKNLKVDDRWAFLVRFKNSGHLAVAQRKGKPRYPIKTLYSLSIPQMLGNEKRIYSHVEPSIKSMLHSYIDEEITKLLS